MTHLCRSKPLAIRNRTRTVSSCFVCRREIFGPVLAIVPVDNIDEAIKVIGQQ
jgi:acyl-CoA reductase-like NAD-dependent aldehyde dehydrogenase